MLNIKLNLKNMMLVAVGAIAFSVTVPVLADGAGAFLGGIAVARIGRSIRENNEAQRDQADAAQQQAYYAQNRHNRHNRHPSQLKIKLLNWISWPQADTSHLQNTNPGRKLFSIVCKKSLWAL